MSGKHSLGSRVIILEAIGFEDATAVKLEVRIQFLSILAHDRRWLKCQSLVILIVRCAMILTEVVVDSSLAGAKAHVSAQT
jgi:hypothetical protein